MDTKRILPAQTVRQHNQASATTQLVGIDELARRKGHVYDTTYCDLGHARVLEVCEGCGLRSVKGERWKRSVLCFTRTGTTS